MSKTQKIIGAVLAAVTLILAILAFTVPEITRGQAAVGYPQAAAATTVQPVLLTNVQIATIAIVAAGAKLGPQQVTNYPTGIVADTNAIITVSNPYLPQGVSASGASITTNNAIAYGVSSNGVVYYCLYNAGTNLLAISNSLAKIKVESWQ